MWFGHIVGESSSWALGAAEGWLIFNLAESNPSSWVGAVFFAAMIPWFIAKNLFFLKTHHDTLSSA